MALDHRYKKAGLKLKEKIVWPSDYDNIEKILLNKRKDLFLDPVSTKDCHKIAGIIYRLTKKNDSTISC